MDLTSSGASGATPPVTVVIPCFNQGRFVDEALASVAAQTLPGVEVLVVDDGSTDESTIAHLASLAASGVRVVTTPNRGVGAARNATQRDATRRNASQRIAPRCERTRCRAPGIQTHAFVNAPKECCWMMMMSQESASEECAHCSVVAARQFNEAFAFPRFPPSGKVLVSLWAL